MRTFIFACPHNGGRSQMASAFFNAFADLDSAHALSAGKRPKSHAHPKIVRVMQEVGIDLTGLKPQRWSRSLTRGPALLVTMGCGEDKPFLPGMGSIDWPIRDVDGLHLGELRSMRDEIRGRVLELLRDESVGAREQTFAPCTQTVFDDPALHFPQAGQPHFA